MQFILQKLEFFILMFSISDWLKLIEVMTSISLPAEIPTGFCWSCNKRQKVIFFTSVTPWILMLCTRYNSKIQWQNLLPSLFLLKKNINNLLGEKLSLKGVLGGNRVFDKNGCQTERCLQFQRAGVFTVLPTKCYRFKTPMLLIQVPMPTSLWPNVLKYK